VALVSTADIPDIVKAAYNEAILLGYAPETFLRPFCNQGEVRDNAPVRGSSITWTILGQLAAATGTLSETADPSTVALTDTQPAATLNEYGNVTTVTEKIKVTSFLDATAGAMMAIGQNMGASLEQIIAAVALAGTNVIYGGAATSRTTIAAGSTITAAKARVAYARLRASSVPRVGDRMEANGRVIAGLNGAGGYVGFIHPHVSHDLRAETGSGSWKAPKEYADPSGIYNGEIGMFEGIRWIETPNPAFLQADASNGSGSTGTVDVYKTLVFGYQYLGEGVGVEPEVRVTGPFDKLGRLVNIGWYGLVGYARVREEAGYRIESSSSLGAN
jgi:N4-gp56 family major capsid protein